MSVRASLEEGKKVRIIYHGGSSPGSTREVIPIFITDHIMRAECLNSGIEKTFTLDKVQLA